MDPRQPRADGPSTPADFADFITDEFAPLAEAYCTLFTPLSRQTATRDLQSLFFNQVNGIGNSFR